MEQAEFAGVEYQGDPGQWVCVGKAWNKAEDWMKSTKILDSTADGFNAQADFWIFPTEKQTVQLEVMTGQHENLGATDPRLRQRPPAETR